MELWKKDIDHQIGVCLVADYMNVVSVPNWTSDSIPAREATPIVQETTEATAVPQEGSGDTQEPLSTHEATPPRQTEHSIVTSPGCCYTRQSSHTTTKIAYTGERQIRKVRQDQWSARRRRTVDSATRRIGIKVPDTMRFLSIHRIVLVLRLRCSLFGYSQPPHPHSPNCCRG